MLSELLEYPVDKYLVSIILCYLLVFFDAFVDFVDVYAL